MGRMKELYMQQLEEDPDAFREDEAYWAEQARWQELYEQEMIKEMSKEAELPVNKKISPCAAHDLEQED
jgi:hypothetical protein